MSKKQLSILIGSLLFILGGVFVLASLSDTSSSASDEQQKVAATTFPLYDMTKNIAPADLSVELVLPAGASPHTFEPSPSNIKNLQGADVLYANGLGLDAWSYTIGESLDIQIVELRNTVELINTDDHDHEDDEHNGEDEFDPHYWLNVENAQLIANAIAADLIERYPDHTEEIQNNLTSYLAELDALDSEIRDTLATAEGRTLVTFHNSFGYFAHAYDLEVIGTFEPTAGREPTAQELIQLTQAMQEANVTVIYSEPQLSTTPLEAFLKDNNISVAVLDPIGGSTETNSYIQLMQYNAQIIAQNQ